MSDLVKFRAFTLAEVLITLGVIGVISAITLPALVQNYQKHVVETKLMKFNSIINQALRLSVADNGAPDSWIPRTHNYSYQETVEFMNTYFLPYIKYVKTGPSPSQNGISVTLLDGSMFEWSILQNGADIFYYANGKREVNPRNRFGFQFAKDSRPGAKDKVINSINSIEPYTYFWDGTSTGLSYNAIWGCSKRCTNCAYCTKLIQLNGWKIPKNYPW